MTPSARQNLLAALAGLREPCFSVPGLPLLPSDALGQSLGLWTLCDAVEAATPEALARWQHERLEALFAHLRGVSPFWAGRLAGWTGELAALPVLSRHAVRAQVAAEGALAVPAGHGAVHSHSTSGSTGVALTMHTDAWVGFLNSQLYLRHALQSGIAVDATSILALLKVDDGVDADWGAPIALLLRTGRQIRWRVTGRDPAELLPLLAAQRGALLVTGPELLHGLVARAADAPGLQGCLSHILTLGASVDGWMREAALRVFGARLIDRYSCEELGPIALECADAPGCYHVCTPNVIVELVGLDGQPAAEGELGRVLVTGLHAAATPFVRYELGDLARGHSTCPCGHRGPVLTDILGRSGEVVVFPGGRRRLILLVARQLLAIAPVHDFRLLRHQALDFELELTLIGGAQLSDAQRAALSAMVHAITVDDAVVRVTLRDAIDWRPGHKRLPFVDLTRPVDGPAPATDLAPQPAVSPVVPADLTTCPPTTSHSRLLAALSGLRDDAFAAPGLALLPSADAGQVLGLWTLCDAVEAMAPAALARWQQDRLAGLIAHWRAVSPFWAARLAGWQGGPGDLAALAPLSRPQVRAQVAAEGALALPAGHGAAHRNTTSGSTGSALAFHCADWAAFLNGQLSLRHTLQCGIAVDATAIVARSRTQDGVNSDWGAPVALLLRTGRQIRRATSGRDPAELLPLIATQRGATLSCWPDFLGLLIDSAASAAGLPDLAGCLSHILTLGGQVDERLRESALRVFGARVIDRYSCEELGPIALECAESPGYYHVATTNVIVELVGLDGQTVANGEQGRVLVTGLQAAATPFVRYELGDLARGHSTCPCGHRGPVLTDILGRSGEVVVYPDGRRGLVHLRARNLLRIAPVLDYRLLRHQALDFELELSLSGGAQLSDAQRDALIALVRAITVADAVVQVTLRDAIDWPPGYKRLTFVDRYAQRQAGS